MLLLCISTLVTAQVNGNLSQLGDKQILQVWGSHYERGYAQGYLLAPQILEVFNDFYWTMFCYSDATFYGTLWSYYMEHFSTETRMYMEAMGMAEGMLASGESIYHNGLGRNLGIDELLLLNAVFDMSSVRNAKGNTNNFQLGCASLSSWGNATQADSLLAGGSVITRFFDASQNSALIGNPLMVVHNPAESDESKWINFTFPGFFGASTAISQANVYASLNVTGDGFTANPQTASPVLFTLRQGIERLDYDQSGGANPLDLLAGFSASWQLSGQIIHTLGENEGNVYSSVIESKQGSTQNRLYNQGGNLPTHHLAATNHFRVLASPACCTRYSNIQDSLYADPQITAKRQWRLLSGAAGLETTLSAIQYVPSTGSILWASASLAEPAYTQPALSLNIADLFSYAVSNSDELAPRPQASFRAYPNPLARKLKLNILSDLAISRLEVFNLKGQRVLLLNMDAKAGESKIDADWHGLPQGIYLLKASSADGRISSSKIVLSD